MAHVHESQLPMLEIHMEFQAPGLAVIWEVNKQIILLMQVGNSILWFKYLSSCHHAGDPGGAPGFGQTLPRLLLFGSESAGAIYYFLFFLCLLLLFFKKWINISRRNDEGWHGTFLQKPLHKDEGWMNGCLVTWRLACQGLSRTCIRLKNNHQMDKKESISDGFWFFTFRILISATCDILVPGI